MKNVLEYLERSGALYPDKISFADTEKLYRLDQIASSSGGKKELGPLPATSIALLAGLAVIWLLIGCYMLTGYIKKRKTENKQG